MERLRKDSCVRRRALLPLRLIVGYGFLAHDVQLRYGFSSVNTVGLTPSGPLFGPPGYEINLLYIAALIALIMAGPGALSFDAWRARRRIAATQT